MHDSLGLNYKSAALISGATPPNEETSVRTGAEKATAGFTSVGLDQSVPRAAISERMLVRMIVLPKLRAAVSVR
jgi:hypothetical protein